MREIARSILKQYGIKVPTDSKSMVTHQAIKTLINVLQIENQKNNKQKLIEFTPIRQTC